MPSCTSSCKIRLFADDTLAFHQITNSQDVSNFQEDLNSLAAWSETWQMNFNASKCEYMRIERGQSSHSAHRYTFSGSILTPVSHIKYLGINIDCNLSFDKHIQEMCSKATRILHMLMRNLRKARTKTRAIAYKSLCRPILEYASQSWSPYKKKHVTTIEAINRKAFHWAHSKRKRDSISALMSSLDWQTLEERRISSDLKFYIRVSAGLSRADESTIVATTNNRDHSRVGAIDRVLNTDAMRNVYKYRMHRYFNTMSSNAPV